MPKTAPWFQGDQRRECILTEYNLLRSAGSEKRCQMKIGIPLPGDHNLQGAPEWVIEDCNALLKASRISKRVGYEPKEGTINGMTVEMWSTEKIRSRFFTPLTGCTLRPLSMERTGKDDAKEIVLYFMVYANATEEIHKWAYHFDKATFWASFDLVQGELDLEGDQDDESEDADDDGEESDDEDFD